MELTVVEILLFVLCMKTSYVNSTNPQDPIHRYLQATRVNSFDNKIPNDTLVDLVSGLSELQCGVNCALSKTCVSFFHNQETRECRLYEGASEDIPTSTLQQENGSVHYRFIKAPPTSVAIATPSAAGLIGDSCLTANCTVDFFECRSDGTCGCLVGYSFQNSTQTCEASCGVYGDTFQTFQQHALFIKSIWNLLGTDVDRCIQDCIDESSTTCVSFDFNSVTDGCHPKDKDALDAPGSYLGDPDYIHFQRNCA